MSTQEKGTGAHDGDDERILVARFVPPTAGMLRNGASFEVQRDTELGLKLERERVARVEALLNDRRERGARVSGVLSRPSPER